jgi:hypothetical protein
MKVENNNLFVAPDQVRNSSNNIVQNENATLDNVGKKSNSYTCFIPENLDLDSLIRDNTPSIPNFHVDYLVYMTGLLIEIPIANKDIELDFVPINSKLIQRRVRNYRKYLDYLISCGVILEDKQYIVGSKSKGFKFTERFQVKTKLVTLTKKTLIKSINEFKDINYLSCDVGNYFSTLKSSKLINQKSDLSYITNWLNSKLTINYPEAEAYLLRLKEIESSDPEIKNANERFIYRHVTLLKFHRGIFSPSEDETAGRLHSALTQIKGDLRSFISYDRKNLTAIDIVNSQPYLAIALLNPIKLEENNIINMILSINPKLNTKLYPIMLVKKIIETSSTDNTKLFVETVSSGRFYEDFGLILKQSKVIDENLDEVTARKKAKGITFSALFSPNMAIAYREEIKIFRSIFPSIFEVFKLIKFGKGQHNTLAILLQQLEAKLVLHKACKIIFEGRPEIPIFTLHDSIITTVGNESYVKDVLTNVLTEAIGIAPKLKVERWE